MIPLTSSIRDHPLRVQISQEQRVDESRLPESAFADHHERELEAFLHRLAVDLVGQVREADIAWRFEV